MNEDIIKDTPTMTTEELINRVNDLELLVKNLQYSINSGTFGRKIKNDEKTIMSKGRMEIGNKDTIIIFDSENVTYLMWAGTADPATAKFRIKRDGGVEINGVLHA